MLLKVFVNALLSHCWYSCFQLSASNYNNDNPARLPSASVGPGEQKKLQLIAFGWQQKNLRNPLVNQVIMVTHLSFRCLSPDLGCEEAALPNVGVDPQDFHPRVPAVSSSASKGYVNVPLCVKPVCCPVGTSHRLNFANIWHVKGAGLGTRHILYHYYFKHGDLESLDWGWNVDW